jgi:hypothetical protein
MYQGIRYMVHNALMGGARERGLEIPPEELADPLPLILRRRGLGRLEGMTTKYTTGYGYGFSDTPAVYPERMLNVRAMWGAATSPQIMWENGTQPMWKGVAKDLDVRTSTAVDRVDRSGGDVRIYTNGSQTPQHFDRVVVAIDPHAALKVLDATDEERAVFSQVQHMPYATFAARVEGFADGRAEVGYLKENMSPDHQGRPMAWIKRYPDDNVFVFHLFAPASISDAQVVANIQEDMHRLGAGRVTLLGSRRWAFFPHVSSDSMRIGRFFERAANLQGRNRTVFVNEALGMSTMADSAELGRKTAQRLAAGEY